MSADAHRASVRSWRLSNKAGTRLGWLLHMSLRQHEIAEANHRILNPFTDEKLMTLGTICGLQPGQRMLDLACGKGELLCPVGPSVRD